MASERPGQNSVLTDEERMLLFFDHANKRRAIEGKIAILQKEKKEAGNRAQADDFKLSDIDYANKTKAAENPKPIVDSYFMRGEILGWLGVIPKVQFDLFKDRAPAIERIEHDGQVAGLMAIERASGYAAMTDEDRVWLQGYDKGQALMRDKLQATMEKQNSAKLKASGEGELIKASEAKQKEKAAAAKPAKPVKAAKAPPPPKERRKGPAKPAADEPTGFGEGEPAKPDATIVTNAELEARRQGTADFH